MLKIIVTVMVIFFTLVSPSWSEVTKLDCTFKMVSQSDGWSFSYFELELDYEKSSIRLSGIPYNHDWANIYLWDQNFILWFVFRPEDYYGGVYSLNVKTGYLDAGNVSQYREEFFVPLIDQGVSFGGEGYSRCAIRNPFLLLPPSR